MKVVLEATEYIKDIYFASGKLCIVCKIQYVEEVVQAMKEMANQLNSKLSGEQIAEMCGIYNFTPSRSPRVDKIWQYTGTGTKKTPVDIYIPDDLDPVEINQFMIHMGMVSAANIEPYQPASYAVSTKEGRHQFNWKDQKHQLNSGPSIDNKKWR